jgi:hypothetical protein
MSDVVRSAEVLERILKGSKPLRKLIEQDPQVLATIREELVRYYPTPAYVGDSSIYKAVVWFLGLVALIAMLGAVGLALQNKGDQAIPDVITALGSAAIGALAGLLAPSPTKKA